MNYGVTKNKIKQIGYDSIIFKIDDSSLQYSNSIQYYDGFENNQFTYFNSTNNSIYFLDYLTKKQDSIWDNTISNHIFDSYTIKNKDSIFLFSTTNKKLYLYNLRGDFKKEFDLSQETINDSTILPYPYMSTNLPLVSHKGSLYLTGYQVGELFTGGRGHKQRKTILKLDTDDKQLSYHINYPDLYNKFNWGATYYYMTSSTYNPLTQSLIVNFPISHNLYVYDLVSEKGRYVYAGSSYIKSIEPFSKDKSDFVDSNKRLIYYITNSSYISIFYDRYKDVYYRISALPMQKKEIVGKDYWKKRQFQLIVLDNNFETLGEISINNIIPENIFINEKGIHLQNFSNEDEMKFKIINIKI
ncbi:DUF4221 family protein [Aureibaculum sp. 2210JD6-5]|uniref:DUF4221 family protein n=1 Tax=Aureibaculum sp. 2210JD6-5 TaxID=3103957 RepID=UPI002ABE993B|nr:DUF4221 family protein [Aureibaculum sp. 2210JD6-5]